MKNVVILGAGSHTRSVKSLLNNCGYKIECIVDINSDAMTDETINDIKVVAKGFDTDEYMKVLSIGDNFIREEYFLKHENILQENMIHSKSDIADDVSMGNSNQVFANVYINENVNIGDNNIINTGAIIEHESIIGSHNHIAIGVVVAGRVNISDRCFIGANSTVIDKVTICSDVIIGAGSVVIEDITKPGTYVGNPARKVK